MDKKELRRKQAELVAEGKPKGRRRLGGPRQVVREKRRKR